MRSSAGYTVIELVLALALIGVLLALSAPVISGSQDAGDGAAAARYLASLMRRSRQEAVLEGRHVGVVFDLHPDGWRLRVCRDGNGNGLSRAEITTGVDRCDLGPVSVREWFPRADLGRAPEIPGPGGDTTEAVVAFGTARMASFSPAGTSSSGSVTIRTRNGRHWAVRVAGVTGRVRVLRFDVRTRQWIDS
jgi:prepilin-type N-terminal cleavage/methylation domain-containing protein